MSVIRLSQATPLTDIEFIDVGNYWRYYAQSLVVPRVGEFARLSRNGGVLFFRVTAVVNRYAAVGEEDVHRSQSVWVHVEEVGSDEARRMSPPPSLFGRIPNEQ